MKKEFNVIPMNREELLSGLNPSQLKAVLETEGAVQITSVAGSGKTRVLVTRTAYMLNILNIPAEQLALMTFTKKAAGEMKERLEQLISKKDMETMFCGTSHSFGYGVLANAYRELNNPLKDFANPKRGHKAKADDAGVLMGNSQTWFAEKVVKTLMSSFLDKDIKDALKETGLKSLLSVVSRAKNEGLDCYEYEAKHAHDAGAYRWACIHFYKQYEAMKLARLSIDGDDMLFLTVRLFREHPEILKKYQRKIKYIMIDETQDNNPTQYELATMLAYPENNLFVVGDDDQSMYGFRGAEPNLFINFDKAFPNVKSFSLEDNYRSHPQILECANKLISNNKNRIVKKLIPHKTGDGKAVYYSHYVDEVAEGEALVKELQVIHETKGLQYKDIAVLYRTNAQCKEIEDGLITNGIPYVIHGGFSFYERKEVKDVMAYLRLVIDTNNNEAFTRVYNTPSRYMGKAYLDKLKAVKGSSLWDATTKVNLTTSERTGTNSFKVLVNSLKQVHASGFTITQVIEHLLENGYGEHLKSQNEEADAEEQGNPILTKLMYFAGRFSTLEKMVEYVDTMSSKRKDSVNGVQLMTIHRSKGLEFEAVFGVGLNENLLPHFKAIDSLECFDESGLEEERRLAYVLVTRGKQYVGLSSTTYFNGKVSGASRFIHEMELVADNIEKEEVEAEEETA